MIYTFINSDNNKKSNIDLPDCVIKTNDKSYVVKDSKIKVFQLDEDGEPTGEGIDSNFIELSGKNISIFNKLAQKDNYNTRLDVDDLSDLSKKEFKNDISEIYGNSEDFKIKRAKIRDYSFKIRVKDKNTKEIETLSYEELRPGFWARLWQKIKPKKKVKYKTEEFSYKVKEGETIESISKKFDIPLEKLIDKNSFLETSPVLEKGQIVTIPKHKHKTKIVADNIQTIPEHNYVVDNGVKKLATIANMLGISQHRLLEANPNLQKKGRGGKTYIRELNAGEEILIPEYKVVTRLNDSSLKGIAEQIGVSETYIEDILFGIEGRHSKPDLKPYYDGVKDKSHPNGYLTIGFGHTGRVFGVEMNSKNKDSIEITEDEAYLILAQDLFIAKQDAENYFGEDFSKAPLSIQEAIIDIVFNKGIEGLKRENSPCLDLEQNLREKDYISAAANSIVDPTVRGLMKRNIYRVLVATRDLKAKDRMAALEKAEQYYQKTLSRFKDNPGIANTISKHWEDAHEGKVFGFFK